MRKQHQIKTEIQRTKLRPRTAIYWNVVSPNHAIGIRRYIHSWAWCCRNGSVHTFADSGDLSYDAALAMITEFWKQESDSAASYTVRAAVRDYARHQRLHKGLKAEVAAERTCSRALSSWLDRELASITKSELDVSANLGTGVDMLSKTYYKFLPSGMKSQLDAVRLG